MRARQGHHVDAGHRGRTSACWRGAVVVAVAALSLAASAVPASAGGYTVTATIPVGFGPIGVAVNPAAGTVYVANYNGGTVSVIDAATNTVTATIPVGGTEPTGVAVDPGAGTVYVTNVSATVSVIDAASSTVTATIPVGNGPFAVAVDPAAHTAYVANDSDNTVSVISGPLAAPPLAAPPLAAPSGLAAAVVGPVSGPPSGVVLTWTDNATAPAATLVQVERAPDPGFSTGVTDFTVGAADITYTDTAVVEGATYYYRVRAENDSTTSGWSDPVPVTFTTVPAAPAG